MFLTRRALGNLINRYNAVLGKCRLLNAFGSLAVAGLLVMGGAGAALAADPTPNDAAYWSGTVTINSNNPVTTVFPETTAGQNVTATSVTLEDGGSLSLSGGARLINGVPGTAGDDAKYMDFKVTGGTLTVGASSPETLASGINASINARTVNISGGTVGITGKDSPSNWYEAAQIGGYRGLTVSGGTVNMNSYSELFGGGATGLQVTGGTINMLGGTSSSTGIDNTAAHIMFGGTSNNLIASGATINVGSGSSAGYGVMTTGGGVTMSGGNLNVTKGALLLQPDTNGNTAGTEDIVYSGSSTSSFNQSGGTVAVATDGNLILGKGITYTLGAGGAMQLAGGTIQLNDGSHMNLEDGSLTVTGGAFKVTDSNIADDVHTHLKFSATNFAHALEKSSLTIDGGFVSAGDSATLDASKFVSSVSSAGDIAFDASHSGNLYAKAMTINTADGTLDTKKKGVLTSDTLAIQSTGTSDKVDITNATLVLTGKDSTLAVTQGSTAVPLTLGTNSALLIGADPALYSGTKTAAINAAVNVGDGGQMVVGYNNGSGVTAPASATFSRDVTINSTTPTALTVVKGSTMTMGAGTTLDFVKGAGTIDGTLDVTAAGSNLKTTVSDGVITVNSGGMVSATKNSLAIDTATNIKEKLVVKGGGTLKVSGLGEINLTDLGTVKSGLMSGAGIFDVSDATISGISGGTVAYSSVQSLGSVTNSALRASTVTGVNGDLSGAYTKVELASSGTLSVADGTTLQLTGSSTGGNIVATATATAGALTVANGGTVLLGNAASANTGAVGDVALSGTGALKVVGNNTAAFTAGNITGTGEVSANGASLTAGTIAAGTLSATNGTVNGSSINATTLSATNGTVKATGAITATNTTLANNGVIQSTGGNVTLTNGLANGSGNVQANTGSIDASGTDLTAGTGSTLNLVAGDAIKAKNISATSVQAKTLTATGDVTVSNGNLTASGTGADASTINGLTLTNSKGTVGKLTVNGITAISGGSSVIAGELIAGGNITVGTPTDTAASRLLVTSLELAGHTLFIDPAWGSAPAITAVGSTTTTGDMTAGQNSMLLLGSTNAAWLEQQVSATTNGTGLSQNGVTAALGVYQPITLGAGFDLTVDGSLVAAPAHVGDRLTFANNSLLVISSGAATSANGAITSAAAAATATIADSAKLRIADALVGQSYKVLDPNKITTTMGANGTGWTGANFSTDSKMVTGTYNAATGVLTTGVNSAANVYPNLDNKLVTVLNNAYAANEVGPSKVNSDTKGVRFLSRATSDAFIGGDTSKATKTIESAARMAVIGAVPQMTMAASNAAGSAVTQRTSIARPDGGALQSMAADGTVQNSAAMNKSGFALWVMPLYQSSNGFGLKGSNAYNVDYHGGLGGVALGADYTFDNSIRAGITFNMGGGFAEGSGDFNKTTNNMSFWGLGAYAGWAKDNFGLTADVNYTSTYNKLSQDMPSGMAMRDLKSDVTAYAISTGLRGEYKFATSAMDIVPHVGVRYMSLNTNDYDVKSEGTVLKGDGINQSIWTFPVGVSFSRTLETGNGWHFKPILDLSVVPAAGDIKAKNTVRFTGTSTSAELETQTMDYVSYMGGLGMEFGKENMALGVNYNLQVGAKTTAHGVFGTFRYEF